MRAAHAPSSAVKRRHLPLKVTGPFERRHAQCVFRTTTQTFGPRWHKYVLHLPRSRLPLLGLLHPGGGVHPMPSLLSPPTVFCRSGRRTQISATVSPMVAALASPLQQWAPGIGPRECDVRYSKPSLNGSLRHHDHPTTLEQAAARVGTFTHSCFRTWLPGQGASRLLPLSKTP